MILVIDPQLERQMKDDALRESDIATVLEYCESQSEYLLDRDTGRRTGHLTQGHITIWVEYRPEAGDCFFVYKAYSHRMTIKDERCEP